MSAEGSSPEETLRRLEERLDQASAAAERLMAEAAGAAAAAGAASAAGEPPPSGWQIPESETDQRHEGDLEALIALARSVRDLIPPELQQRLISALRDLIHALRDLLDWYLERLDRQRAEPEQVQDIPIL